MTTEATQPVLSHRERLVLAVLFFTSAESSVAEVARRAEFHHLGHPCPSPMTEALGLLESLERRGLVLRLSRGWVLDPMTAAVMAVGHAYGCRGLEGVRNG